MIILKKWEEIKKKREKRRKRDLITDPIRNINDYALLNSKKQPMLLNLLNNILNNILLFLISFCVKI